MKLDINGKIIELDKETVQKALEDENPVIELKKEDLIIRSKDEDSVFSENLRKEGIATGAEIGRKEVIKGIGIEGEGLHKSDESAISAIKTWHESSVSTALKDAGQEPDKKLAEKDKDIRTLQTTVADLQEQKQSLESNFATYKKDITIQSTLSSLIPENAILPKNDMLKLMKDGLTLDIDENGHVYGIGSDGQPMKDPTTLALKPVKDVIKGYFDQNPQYLKKSDGGAGGGDSGGASGKQSMAEFITEMKEAGHTVNGAEFNNIMGERIKAGTLDI